jgi:Kef-type K+ transport system membrane component KefB
MTAEEVKKMQTFQKNHLVILITAVIVVSLIFMILAIYIDTFQYGMVHISAKWLLISKVVAILYILYIFVRLWFWPQRILKKFASQHPQHEMSRPRLSVLLFCYGTLMSPNLFGLVLLFWGMPISQFYYFTGASILGGLTWGGYNLRKTWER